MARGLRFKHKSRLRRKFDPEEERRRLLREPNRAKVEGIRELRNRPDPEGDAFLANAAEEAGIDPVKAGFRKKKRRKRFKLL